MEKIVVQGGDNRLVGSVTIEGAKNAVLPLLARIVAANKGKTAFFAPSIVTLPTRRLSPP